MNLRTISDSLCGAVGAMIALKLLERAGLSWWVIGFTFAVAALAEVVHRARG